MAKYIDLTGKQIGKWKVITRLGVLKNRGLHTFYRCQCKCGNEQDIPSTNLVEKKTKGCRSCSRKGRYRFRLAAVFSRVKKNAEARNIKFSITHNYVLRVMKRQEWKCALTKLPLEVKWGVSEKGNTISSLSTASLDRIDPTKGYIRGNVQWVYKPINMMKWKLTQEEFIRLCRLIVKNQKTS